MLENLVHEPLISPPVTPVLRKVYPLLAAQATQCPYLGRLRL